MLPEELTSPPATTATRRSSHPATRCTCATAACSSKEILTQSRLVCQYQVMPDRQADEESEEDEVRGRARRPIRFPSPARCGHLDRKTGGGPRQGSLRPLDRRPAPPRRAPFRPSAKLTATVLPCFAAPPRVIPFVKTKTQGKTSGAPCQRHCDSESPRGLARRH